MSSKIKVYFEGHHTLVADRDKVGFQRVDGTFFTLSDTYTGTEEYPGLIKEGRVLVNWEKVLFVVQETKEEKDPYEE